MLGWASLAAIATAILTTSPDADYPSFAAALPVAGAAGLIAAGLARADCWPARLLAAPPLVTIGLWSYAWYLWHWPLILFTREYFYGAPPTAWLGAAAALSLVLAWLTHQFLEVPIRQWRKSRKGRLGWGPAGIGTLLMLAVGAGLFGFGELRAAQLRPSTPQPLDPSIVAAASQCRVADADAKIPSACLAGLGGRRLGLLIGDSHAAATFPAFAAAAGARNAALAIVTNGDCPPVSALPENQGPCSRLHRNLDRLLSSDPTPIAFAILVSYWQLYVGDGPLIEGRRRRSLARIDAYSPADDAHGAFVEGLRTEIGALQKHGVGRILILGPTPNFPDAARDCLMRARRNGENPADRCTLGRGAADAEQQTAQDWLREATAGLPNVQLADPRGAFCDAVRCSETKDGTLLFYDNDHPTEAGAQALLSALAADVSWVLSP
jgi:hypothetical protein